LVALQVHPFAERRRGDRRAANLDLQPADVALASLATPAADIERLDGVDLERVDQPSGR